MWHVSIAPRLYLLQSTLRDIAFNILKDYGQASKGEWQEYENNIFHLRRRLSDGEQAIVGDVLDIRGTPEQDRRHFKVKKYLPEGYKDFKD